MIQRNLFNELISEAERKEISFIVGPRQAGKTTLMLYLKKHLEDKGKKTVYINLDIEADTQYFTSQANLIAKIKLEIGESGGFVFIDEIQRKKNAGLFLKGIYDMNLPYKFFVSGSGSIELKEKIKESLVGRKRVLELSTLTFDEFVNFKTDYHYKDKLLNFFALEKEKTKQLLKEYLTFGGYPKVVLEETAEEKQKAISEIYQSYIERDIYYLLKIQKDEAFTRLVKLLSSQIGQLVNHSELSSTLSISVKTLKNYLWYLEKTYVLKKVTPYFRNARKEITKSPIYYFSDLGMRNFASGVFGQSSAIENNGFVFQNFIFNFLNENIKNRPTEIHFWRTKDKAEVDFIIDTGVEQTPIEVKYQNLKKEEITRSLRNYIKKYQPKRSYIINLELEKEINLKQTKVIFLPFYQIPKYIFSN